MPSFSKRVAAVRDCITRTSSGYFAETDPLYWTDPGLVHRQALRFTGVTIPKGATITSATLTIYNHQNQPTPNAADWVAFGLEQVDNATQVTSASNMLTRFSSIGSTVNWAYSTTPRDAANVSPDLSALLQVIIDRSGWTSGNAVQFLGASNVSAVSITQMRSYYTGAAGTYALLSVDYTTPDTDPTLIGVGSTSTSLTDYPKTGSVTTGDWYVDGANGNDGNSGTSLGSAFKTIGAAVTAASSSHTIIVRGGTYALSAALNVSKQVNVYNYSTERWVIDRGNGGTTSGVNHAGIRITANGAKIKGFGVKGVPIRSDADYATYAVEVASGTSNVVVEDGVIWSSKSGSVMLYQCSGPLVMDVITIGSSGAGSASNMPDGIVATANSGQATTNATIVRCLAANVGDDCYDLFRATGAKIVDCVAISAGISHTGANLGDGNGFKMGGTGSGNNTLRGSISVYGRTTGITNNANAGTAGLFINNTAAHNARGLLSDDGTYPQQTNNIALNNTVYNQSVAGSQTNNTWNLSITNASFSDVSNGDWSLDTGSACIAAGTSGANLGASVVALALLKKWWNHSLIWVTGRGAGSGGTGLPGDS